MRKGDVSLRKVACRVLLALGCFVFSQLVGARGARADSPRKVEGFEVVGTLGYGFPVGATTVNPYGVTLGLDLGYTLPFGLRIGADAIYGFGRTSEDVTDIVSFAFGGSAGYDLLLSSFRLRGALDMGLALYSAERGRVEGAFLPGGSTTSVPGSR
jgi:hypothetical protein